MPVDLIRMLETDNIADLLRKYSIVLKDKDDIYIPDDLVAVENNIYTASDNVPVGFDLSIRVAGDSLSKRIPNMFYDFAAKHYCQKGEIPKKLRLSFALNHGVKSGGHWTALTCDIDIPDEYIQNMQNNLKIVCPDHKSADEIMVKEVLIGENQSSNRNTNFPSGVKVEINHYDSLHGYNGSKASYFTEVESSLAPLSRDLKSGFVLNAGKCKEQRGFTCGDHTIYNLVMTGLLKEDVSRIDPMLNSELLRQISDSDIPGGVELIKNTVLRNIQQQPTTEYLSFSNEESSQEESNLFLEAAKELHDQYYKNNYNLEQVKKIAKMAYELNQELDKESLIKLISQNTAFYAEMVFPKKSVSFDFKGTEPVENDPFELKLETTLFYFVGYLQDYISQNRKLTGDGIIKYVQDAGYLKSNNLITKEVRDSANELADACNKLKQNEQLLKSPNIFAKLFGFLSMVFGKGNRHTVEAKLNKLKDKVDSRKDNKI